MPSSLVFGVSTYTHQITSHIGYSASYIQFSTNQTLHHITSHYISHGIPDHTFNSPPIKPYITLHLTYGIPHHTFNSPPIKPYITLHLTWHSRSHIQLSTNQTLHHITSHIQIKRRNISFCKLGAERCEVCVTFKEHKTCDEVCTDWMGVCRVKSDQPEHLRTNLKVTKSPTLKQKIKNRKTNHNQIWNYHPGIGRPLYLLPLQQSGSCMGRTKRLLRSKSGR